MIIVNVNSGLGNQMYHYAMYLALKHLNKTQQCYIDNSIFEICGKSDKYELEKIFDLDIPNVSSLVNEQSYKQYIKKSKIVADKLPNNWLSKSAIMCRHLFLEMLSEVNTNNFIQITDLVSVNKRSYKHELLLFLKRIPVIADFFYKFKSTHTYNLRSFYSSVSKMTNVKKYRLEEHKYYNSIMKHESGNWYYIGNFEDGTKYFKDVQKEIREAFKFPDLDDKNKEIASIIGNTESVSIHVRRGDHLASNVEMNSKENYFVRSTRYIKNHLSNPVFFIFSDDINWCKEHPDLLGLSEQDEVYYVSHNTGKDSYKDMQLMSMCKNNIIPISTFSWWAAYLNENPEKIVIAPQGYWADASKLL